VLTLIEPIATKEEDQVNGYSKTDGRWMFVPVGFLVSLFSVHGVELDMNECYH
jgi:hypothetical protein